MKSAANRIGCACLWLSRNGSIFPATAFEVSCRVARLSLMQQSNVKILVFPAGISGLKLLESELLR
jgi:hypothetical protein